MEGDIWLFSLLTVLFIVATQSVAVILYALFPVLSLVISVVSMVGSLGATLSGLTFPLSAMSPVVQYTAKLFPVRHFTESMQCMVYFDGGFSACWPQLAVLCLFPLLAVVLLHFKNENEDADAKGASVATATRYDSVACDERNFSSSEERALAP